MTKFLTDKEIEGIKYSAVNYNKEIKSLSSYVENYNKNVILTSRKSLDNEISRHKKNEIKSLAGYKLVVNTNHEGNSVLFHLLDDSGNVVETEKSHSDIAKNTNLTESEVKSLPFYWLHKDGSVTQEFSQGGIIFVMHNFLTQKVSFTDLFKS